MKYNKFMRDFYKEQIMRIYREQILKRRYHEEYLQYSKNCKSNEKYCNFSHFEYFSIYNWFKFLDEIRKIKPYCRDRIDSLESL